MKHKKTIESERERAIREIRKELRVLPKIFSYDDPEPRVYVKEIVKLLK